MAQDGGVQLSHSCGEYKDDPEVKHICYTHWDTGIQGLELEAQY